MLKFTAQWLLILFFSVQGLGPISAQEGSPKLPEEEMLKLVNSKFGNTPLYESKDIPAEFRNQYDFNGDGTPEWVIVPATACGSTKNCTFFLLQFQKKKGWQMVFQADGKLTSLSPWGLIISPHQTNGYHDIITVFDEGPEPNGTRSLTRTIYTWNGKSYERFSGAYPPSDASPEVGSLLQEIDKLKFEKIKIR